MNGTADYEKLPCPDCIEGWIHSSFKSEKGNPYLIPCLNPDCELGKIHMDDLRKRMQNQHELKGINFDVDKTRL